ncbi:hypothetical protein H2203_003882 [Taxawa tesnikishii (nom. ined.)]|nr:hypothetical protein H2203_003882 [Dothideales sp. JES 119]
MGGSGVAKPKSGHWHYIRRPPTPDDFHLENSPTKLEGTRAATVHAEQDAALPKIKRNAAEAPQNQPERSPSRSLTPPTGPQSVPSTATSEREDTASRADSAQAPGDINEDKFNTAAPLSITIQPPSPSPTKSTDSRTTSYTVKSCAGTKRRIDDYFSRRAPAQDTGNEERDRKRQKLGTAYQQAEPAERSTENTTQEADGEQTQDKAETPSKASREMRRLQIDGRAALRRLDLSVDAVDTDGDAGSKDGEEVLAGGARERVATGTAQEETNPIESTQSERATIEEKAKTSKKISREMRRLEIDGNAALRGDTDQEQTTRLSSADAVPPPDIAHENPDATTRSSKRKRHTTLPLTATSEGLQPPAKRVRHSLPTGIMYPTDENTDVVGVYLRGPENPASDPRFLATGAVHPIWLDNALAYIAGIAEDFETQKTLQENVQKALHNMPLASESGLDRDRGSDWSSI